MANNRHAYGLWSDREGSTGIMFALLLTPLVLLLGAAVDYGRAVSGQRLLTTAVDSAVIAGASMTGATDSERIARATAFFNENNKNNIWTATSGNPTVTSVNGVVSVSITGSVPTTAMKVAGINTIDVNAATDSPTVLPTSTVTNASPCVLALAESGRDTFYFDSESLLKAPNCEVHVRSNDAHAVYLKSLSQVSIKKICVKGKAYGDSYPTIVENCEASPDPYAGNLPPTPAMDSCSAANTGKTYTGTVSPGTYCGVTTFNGSSVTMRGGVYVVRSTAASAGSAAAVDGLLKMIAQTISVTPYNGVDGVTIYIADERAGISLVTKENTKISAPTTGPYANWLLFQPTSLPAMKTVTLGSADKTVLKGIFYAPNWNLRLDSWSDWLEAGTSKMNIIVNTFYAHSLSHVALEPMDTVTTTTTTVAGSSNPAHLTK